MMTLLKSAGADVTSSSTMVALIPPAQWRTTLEPHAHNEQLVDGLHCTLFYLGETGPDELGHIHEILSVVADELEPITLEANGAGCFCNDDAHVRYLIPNGPGLDVWRHQVASNLRPFLKKDETHGFVPHITLEYHKDEPLPRDFWQVADEDFDDWDCRRLYLVRGNEIMQTYEVGA